jgi:hypothetical protein
VSLELRKAFHIGLVGAIGGLSVVVASTVALFIVANHIAAERGESLDQLLKKLEHVHMMGGSGQNAPVKVRGGSMTFHTNQAGGWVLLTSDPSAYCAPIIDYSAVDLTSLHYVPSPVHPTAKYTWEDIEGGWTIEIRGRDFTGKNASQNGIKVTSSDTSCDGTSPGQSIILKPINQNSGFYFAPVPDEKSKLSVRFQDKSCANKPTNSGDEDLCERISIVNLTITSISSVPFVFKCPKGECDIGIGL